MLGGCLEGYPGLHESGDYGLSVTGTSEQFRNGSVVFRGTVALQGSLGAGAIVNDVRVVFRGGANETIATTTVGTLSIGTLPDAEPHPRATISVELPEPPEIVILEIGRVETENTIEVYGLRRTQTGEFEAYLLTTVDA